MIDSIPTIVGNKSFSKVDSINSKTIIKEARLKGIIRQKNEQGNHNPSDPAITQNDLPNLPGNDPLPPVEDRGLGRRFITVNGQYLRRLHRLYATQSFENGDSGH